MKSLETRRFGTLVALVAVAVAGALAVPAVAGATVRSFLSTRCSVAPGNNARFDSATGPVSFNYPHFGGLTSAYADAATHSAGGYSGAQAGAGTSDDCTTDALFRDTVTVGAGSTGLPAGTPVTLRLDADLTGQVDGGGFTHDSFLGSVDVFVSYKLTGTELDCSGGEGCEFPELARLGFDLSRVMDASTGTSSDPDGSVTDALRWGWDLTSNAAPAQGDSEDSYVVVCPAYPDACAFGPPIPAPQPFQIPVGARSIELQTTIGAEIAIEGRLNILSQAYGPGLAYGDLLHSLHTDISPAEGYEGIALSYESAPVGPPADTAEPTINCDAPDSLWHTANVSISCTASDTGSGLANAGDAAFTLTTSAPADAEDANARTGSRQVCDVAGNCATAGPIGGIKIDFKAPTLNVPADITVDATAPASAVVTFSATATDGGSGVANVNCPGSGSTFPLGTTLVACTATDNVGNSSIKSFSVTVRDVDPPKLSLPSGVSVNATSSAGATVNYAASATDVSDPNPQVTCTPPSGSTFPIGTTTVVCVALDNQGNSSSGTFVVRVKGAKDQLADLIQKVVNASALSPSAKTLLIGKLNQLLASFDPTNATQRQAVCLALQVFKAAVQLQAGKTITQAQAAEWIADANRIRAVLAC
jgi:hypothetical protein